MSHDETPDSVAPNRVTPNSVMRLIRTGGPVHGATLRITKPRPLRKVVENGKLLPEYAHIVIYDDSTEETAEPSLPY